jgi:aspartyl-tRNA(Asn)/glutamyl-tRNA(Gln) amidotransferase subunit A
MLGRNAMVFNILDFCAVNLPVALDPAGLPIGMQVLTRRFEEEKLLAAAHAIERTLGTTLQRLGRPPLCP